MAPVSDRCFPRHAHDQFGIGVSFGAQRSWSGIGPVEAEAGDVITVNPGEMHDGRPLDGRARGWRMLYIDPGVAARELSDEAPRAVEIGRPAIRDPLLAARFARLFATVVAHTPDPLAMEQDLLTTLAHLLRRHGVRPFAGSGAAALRDAGAAPHRRRARASGLPRLSWPRFRASAASSFCAASPSRSASRRSLSRPVQGPARPAALGSGPAPRRGGGRGRLRGPEPYDARLRSSAWGDSRGLSRRAGVKAACNPVQDESVRGGATFAPNNGARPCAQTTSTAKTFTPMVAGVRDAAISAGMTDAAAFDAGLRALRRTAETDGAFCYTFFKAVGLKA